jgi:hypothetical protein
MGNKLSADETSPAKPTRKIGCIGISCDAGMLITFGAMTDVIVPTRKLVFVMAAGTTANVESASGDACTVREIPAIMNAIEIIAPAIGPLIAKSNIADRDFGNERSAVIDPKVPTCKDGKGTGRAIFMPDLVAAMRWASSWTALTTITPRNIGKHELNLDMSLLFTTALKNLGFRANPEIA